MKTYTMSFAASIEHKPEHPERTAKRTGAGMNMGVTYRVWPSRGAMLTTIRMQEKRAPHYLDWKAVQK